MSTIPIEDIATGGHAEIQHLWMSASQTRPYFLKDYALWWLDTCGEQFGFIKGQMAEYDFLKFIFKKGHQFESKWVEVNAPEAIQVCAYPWDVKKRSHFLETLRLMNETTPIILQPALWWAPEKIHGVPDVLILSTEVERIFPGMLSGEQLSLNAPNLESTDSGYYLPFDIKFTSKIMSKKPDYGMYSSQIRIYAYMVGQIQGIIPPFGYLLTRDQHLDPVKIPVRSSVNEQLDKDLAEIRDIYLAIKEKGHEYRPWSNDIVGYNMKNDKDAPWHDAKHLMAHEKYPGGDPSAVYEINAENRNTLIPNGFPSIESMLATEPENIPLEECNGIGPAKAAKIRAIIRANRPDPPTGLSPALIPPQRDHELFVDYEYFSNINVDFDAQWPTLEGCEMVFMIGLGWREDANWRYKEFMAEEESQRAELDMVNDFLRELEKITAGDFTNPDKSAIYHWTNPEVWQTKHIYTRHDLPLDHPIRDLTWYDLQKPFMKGPLCIPGAWDFTLKEFAKALGNLNKEYDTQWPEGLGEGLEAMVMGWKSYEKADPHQSLEAKLLKEYLHADCRALYNILNWLRS